MVSFRAGEISLREALDRLAALAGVRLSYSSESLDLDRPVCVAFDSAAVGAILARLLDSSPVRAVSAGGDHVVLAPDLYAKQVLAREQAPVVLERIVVTGSAAGAASRALPVAIDMIEGEDMSERTDGALTQAFNSTVPGMWLWAQSPSSLLAQYGSIRGASSFGLTYPKVYIDGIQVANPLLLTRLTPEAIDHIEVIRGPQGAALYGADAISGVTNIVLRNESVEAGAPRARLRTGVGLASSEFASNPLLGQDHVLTLRSGSNTRSLGANLELGSSGAYIPGAYQQHLALNGTARGVGAQHVVTGTLRVFGERAGAPGSPLLPAPYADRTPITGGGTQSVLQYTAGTSLKLTDGARLSHSLVAGIDGYSLNGVRDERGPIPSAADAALLAAQGGAYRATIRMSSVARVLRSDRATGDFTFVGEQSLLRQWSTGMTAQTGDHSGPGSALPAPRYSRWRNNTGASAQVNVGILNQVYLTGGLRFERASGNDHVATLPMTGVSWVLGNDAISVKLRGAYGKGIRWPETAARETLWAQGYPLESGGLEPERQSGVEAGMDLMLGRTLTLQITRFDQVASGLIQRVMISADTASIEGPVARRMGYQMQNVGRISNRGWEMQGILRTGPLALTGTFSLADSRVRGLAPGYTGDLTLNDRMLDVPARTVSLTAGWSSTRWAATVTGYRAEDWISYDRVALLRSLMATTRPSRDFVGPMLRNYWMTYGGVTHLRAMLSRSIRRGIILTLTGDNLLDQQRGEPDNVTVLPGRTFSVGVRAEF